MTKINEPIDAPRPLPETSRRNFIIGAGAAAAERSATILNKAIAVEPIPEFECCNWDRRGGTWIVMSSAIENDHGPMAAGCWAKSSTHLRGSCRGLFDPVSRSTSVLDIGL